MGNNSLTVLMTVFNNSLYLKESIESVLNQKQIEFNFLILDDGSDEDIEKIISEFKDTRITFIKLKKVGLIAALNAGVKQCGTKYIAILDSDDIASEGRLGIQIQFLEKNPSVGLVGTSIKYITDGMKNSKWAVKMPGDHETILKGLHEGKYVLVHSTIMMRTELLKKINGYREESFPVPDTDLFLRMANVSNLANISDNYSLVRLHENSVTAKHLLSILKKNYAIIRKKKINRILAYKNYFALSCYRKGIINYLKHNYFTSILNFLISFIFAPLRSVYYLKNKLKLSL